MNDLQDRASSSVNDTGTGSKIGTPVTQPRSADVPLALPVAAKCHCGKDGHALNSINCPVHGDWRPVEIAPADVDLLLGWWRDWPEREWKQAIDLAKCTKGGWIHGQATHWRHLPAPPTEATP